MYSLDFLKPYIRESTQSQDRRDGYGFERVPEEEIVRAEERLGYSFPEDLKRFWREIGFGYIRCESEYRNNIILPPWDIADYYLDPAILACDRHYYANKRLLIFFDLDYGYFLQLDKEAGEVINLGRKIAENLEDFVLKMRERIQYLFGEIDPKYTINYFKPDIIDPNYSLGFLKKYMLEDMDFLDWRDGYGFVPVSEESIQEAEEKLQVIFPEGLKRFWREIGSGKIRSEGGYNMLLSPREIITYYKEEFIEKKKKNEKQEVGKRIHFFQTSVLKDFLNMDLKTERIYFGNKRIAENLEDFVLKMKERIDYFRKEKDTSLQYVKIKDVWYGN